MGLRRRELRLGSGVNRLGTASGLNPGVWTPASLGTALLAWNDRTAGYVFSDAGTTRATDGGAVQYVADRRGGTNPHLSLTGGTSTWNAANKAVVCNGATAFTYSPPLVLPGAFTMYAWGSRANSSIWIPATRAAVDQELLIFTDNNVYAIPPNAVVAYTGATGLILVRWRRDSTNRTYLAATGMAESLYGSDGTSLTIDTEAYRPLFGQFTDNGNDHRGSIFVTADTVAAGTDTQILAYLLANYGVSL